ncbi:MAG: 4'-phosphopantetheinyl transferase family protein [Anderseniella sp.]
MLTGEYVVFPEFDIVTSAVWVSHGDPSRLPSVERTAIENAEPGRAREFAAGRQAARQALARMGLDRVTVPRSPERCPIWPTGIIGSISHSHKVAGAAVTKDDRLIGLGFDLEQPTVARPSDIVAKVMTIDEIRQFGCQDQKQLGSHLALVVSCKESVYKAVNPVIGEYFDFLDIEIELDKSSRTFVARASASLRSADWINNGCGRYGSLAGQTVTAFIVEADRTATFLRRH